MEERIDQAALVNEQHAKAGALRLDGGGQAAGAGADDEEVELLGVVGRHGDWIHEIR